MAYIPSGCTVQEYENEIYSQSAKNKLFLSFGGVELTNADLYCEKITIKSRLLSNSNSVFALDNFISKNVEIILHDVDLEDIVEPVLLKIGTLINNNYIYVPIGVFNISETPITDKNKVTLTLRDNSVKFDFYYNAKDLLEQNNNQVTKLQIFNDICTKAGVSTNVVSFLGDSDIVNIADNTITGRTYISYLAEQAGKIATIDRTGQLIFVDLTSSTTKTLPFNLLEKYEIGTSYEISKVLFETGEIKYEAGNDNKDTLYLNTSNVYINNQTQINNILSIVNGFKIDSVTTGKILGNLLIDVYDFITFTDGSNTYTTLAQNDLVYNGVIVQTFDTTISVEERETNVSYNGEATFQRYVKTQLDNVNLELTNVVHNTTFNEYKQQVTEEVQRIQTSTYTKTEINKIITGEEVDGQVVTSVSSTSGTFDENGLLIEKTNAKTKGIFNEVGMKVIDATGSSDSELLFAGYDDDLSETIVRTKNIKVEKYLTIGSKSRLEDYSTGTGVFWVGD